MAQENREAYIAWLREKLEDYCNDDGSYEVYWDYDDSITPDQLVEAVDNWKSEGYTSPESYLASTLYDTVGEAQESQLYVSILDDLNDAPDEVRACWDESTGIWDDLYEAGYTGIDMNLDDLLSRSSFNVNLFFATETEKNFDMGSIVDSFGNDYREPRLEDIDAESLDNALSYLVNQQGHSVEEVFGNPDNAFIHSIREEIVKNSSDAMSELCALVRMDAREMLDLIGKRSEAKGSLVLPRDCATMGIFNQWSGCGGVLDIRLEKDAVMPLSMIRGFQIEGQSDPEGYTVNDVYGLVGSCWKPAQLSDDIETDVKEDYALALQEGEPTFRECGTFTDHGFGFHAQDGTRTDYVIGWPFEDGGWAVLTGSYDLESDELADYHLPEDYLNGLLSRYGYSSLADFKSVNGDTWRDALTGIIAGNQEANRFEVPHLFPDPSAAEWFCTYQGVPGDLLRPAMEKARAEYEKAKAHQAPEKAVSLKGEVETARSTSAAMADNGNHSNRGQDAR